MKNKIGLIVFSVFLCVTANAEDVSRRFDELMLRIRNNEVIVYEYDYFSALENAMSTIVSAGGYYSDSLPEIRCQAYRYASIAALQCESDSIKTMVVEDLLRSCNDSASIVVQNAWQELRKYDRKYFSDNSKRMLEQIVANNQFFPEKFFMIGGYIDSENMASILKNKLYENKELQWPIELALCRLNDSESIQTVLSKVSKVELSLDFIDGVLPDLLYTRQRPIYDWIISKSMSDECKCVSRSPISERQIPCAYYIMYEMADYIDGFPITRDDEGEKDDDLSKSDIKKMRSWIVANPNYKIIDAGY
ncbi:MAG: hypothetical protein IJ911_14315 [Salinivirgaceae bacterium]|nr:hypothetical protein [Salinivirgaceae bacterium]